MQSQMSTADRTTSTARDTAYGVRPYAAYAYGYDAYEYDGR